MLGHQPLGGLERNADRAHRHPVHGANRHAGRDAFDVCGGAAVVGLEQSMDQATAVNAWHPDAATTPPYPPPQTPPHTAPPAAQASD